MSQSSMCETYTSIRSNFGMGVTPVKAEGEEEDDITKALLKEIDMCLGGINGLLTEAGFEIKLAVMDKGER